MNKIFVAPEIAKRLNAFGFEPNDVYGDYTYDQVIQWFIDYHDMYVTVEINPDLYLSRINYSADIRSLAMEKEGLRLANGFTVYQDRHLALIEGIEEALNLIEKE